MKRKRNNVSSVSRKKSKATTTQSKANKRGPAIRSDALKWKEASLPDRLDDAEGFYGLEEIDDVEVIRGPNGTGVLFRPVADAEVDQEAALTSEDDEWEGFENDPAETTQLTQNSNQNLRNGANGSVMQTAHEKEKPLNERLQKRPPTNGQGSQKGHNFNVLDGEVEQDGVDVKEWVHLGLSPTMLSAISKLGFSEPTPIQSAVIQPIRSGQDVIGKAVTGSGKTLAFGIPIIEKWLQLHRYNTQSMSQAPLAFILAPTRELAHQLTKHLRALCESLDEAPRIIPVTGGLSVLKQQRQLETADIIVATPGRMWEVINDSHGLIAKLKQIQFLVVDEADRLLSEGHFKEFEEILDVIDRETVDENEPEDAQTEETKLQTSRQTLVFSATFHKGLQQKLSTRKKSKTADTDLLSNKQSMDYLLHKLPFQPDIKPTFIDANPSSQMAENLAETILECGGMQKDLYLYAYLLQEQNQLVKIPSDKEPTRILVFTNSISSVKRLVSILQSLNLPSATVLPLHSNMAQKARLRSLERFSGVQPNTKSSDKRTAVLIATDVAARGLDIKGISTIVHYHAPRTADTYVHRSGRTARASHSGSSVLLCSPEETAGVTRLIAQIHTDGSTKRVKDIGKLIERMHVPPDLVRQIEKRVDLAQKITESAQATEKVQGEDNWLKTAAEELGVDYDSEEFEEAGQRGRRGRGGGRERKQKETATASDKVEKVGKWKAQLRDDLSKRIDFGIGLRNNAKYLAGGAIDVEKLLAERGHT